MPNYLASWQPPKRRDARAAEWTGLENRSRGNSTGVQIPLSPPLFKHLAHFLSTTHVTLGIVLVYSLGIKLAIIIFWFAQYWKIQCGRNFHFSVINHNLAFSFVTWEYLLLLTLAFVIRYSLGFEMMKSTRQFSIWFFSCYRWPFPVRPKSLQVRWRYEAVRSRPLFA